MTLLEVKNVCKSFGPIDVLHDINFSVEHGEVLGLVGDNGAGKSTLMKTITGITRPTAGDVFLDGKSISGLDPGERRHSGIEMIYQDLALARQQDVASNIFLGREPIRRVLGFMPFVDRARMEREAGEMIQRLGAKIPSVKSTVGSFSGGQQQTVAIAKALTFNPKIVIMDEPTAALAVREVQGVLDLIRRLKNEGIAVILISHRLNDVLSATERIVVLRHGRVVADLKTADTSMNEVVASIVGGDDMTTAAAHEGRG